LACSAATYGPPLNTKNDGDRGAAGTSSGALTAPLLVSSIATDEGTAPAGENVHLRGIDVEDVGGLPPTVTLTPSSCSGIWPFTKSEVCQTGYRLPARVRPIDRNPRVRRNRGLPLSAFATRRLLARKPRWEADIVAVTYKLLARRSCLESRCRRSNSLQS